MKLYVIPFVFGLLHLLYICIGALYLLLFCSTEKKKRANPLEGELCLVEHIVCFKNESRFVKDKLRNCYQIDYPEIHHTFVNDNSSDETLLLLERYSGEKTTIISNSENLGKNTSQINAVEKTDAKFLLFSDANVFIKPCALKTLLQSMDEETGGCCGNVTITRDLKALEFSGRYWELEKWIKRFQNCFGSVIGFDGGFYCVRKANYNLSRENELSDFETAFLLFEQQKLCRYSKKAKAAEMEQRTIKSSFSARTRASNRAFWSYHRIFKYIWKARPVVILHFFFHKLLRYSFVVTLVLTLPFLLIDLWGLSPLLLVFILIPYVLRSLSECIALCYGGIIALRGKEFRTWTDKKG